MKTIFLIADETATENAAWQAPNITRHLHVNIVVDQTIIGRQLK